MLSAIKTSSGRADASKSFFFMIETIAAYSLASIAVTSSEEKACDATRKRPQIVCIQYCARINIIFYYVNLFINMYVHRHV